MVRKKNSQKGGDPWASALRSLTRRDYGTAELRQRLLMKGFPGEAVEQTIARCLDLGYLDDARHVERLTRALLTTGRAAGPRLLQELRRRGLPEELIRTAVTEHRAAGREEDALRELIARRFATFDYAAADERERRRVVFFLQRRGFPLDRILIELKRTDP
ncbi:MAG: recombination regulator RecX [Desulfuromonadales bacterium]|nr:recombination regulator RecX [Desulfuromonadales bacterium]